MSEYANDLVLRAFRGERTPTAPVWLMRQAGRTDPEYRRIREECGLTLEQLFRHPELAARISLLPRRLGVDALIYFQDILTPLAPMGAPFVFRPGPTLAEPVRSRSEVERLQTYDVAAELPFIREIFERIRGELGGEMPVLGFAGAPFTLLCFLAEGSSFGVHAPEALAFLERDPQAARQLLDLLTDVTIDYLLLQIDAGAAAVQLFESAAPMLSSAAFREHALPYLARIVDAVKERAPTILFCRDWADVELMAEAGADVLSLSSLVSVRDARARLGRGAPVQGNLDNALLAEGSREDIAEAARTCVAEGEKRGHVFNLSHGLLRHTPYENVRFLVEYVHSL